MIRLGLDRIRCLLNPLELQWHAIHVAGTNGKGSICAYASALLTISKVKTGRFTSPHLIDRWDCIAINGKPVEESLFQRVEEQIKVRNEKEKINASAFELLTATAFEIFNHEQVEVGVVEVGLGGRLDATNVLQNPLVTVISKIGLDHQEILGNTILEIAGEKAGILKPGTPCIVDAANLPSVRSLIIKAAEDIHAGPVEFIGSGEPVNQVLSKSEVPYTADTQKSAFSCAFAAVNLALERMGRKQQLTQEASLFALTEGRLPGRLHHMDIRPLLECLNGFISGISGPTKVLIDGAHNIESAEALGAYVDAMRNQQTNITEQSIGQRESRGVTWLLATKEDKDAKGILKALLRPGDLVVATTFGQVAGMPWVKPMAAEALLELAQRSCPIDEQSTADEEPSRAIRLAAERAGHSQFVIAGSLYLVGDIFRLIRDTR
ncbi:MAG: folylpolyglutamate synthase [Bogoriella megaspora]|nr:MAG: folylpolyglutamate synthase [Bogoriella megaspora]